MVYESIERFLPSLVYILLYSVSLASGHSTTCDEGACIPAYGNLLIGRENQLTASSTCGLLNPERFCLISTSKGNNCYWCDSRNKNKTTFYYGIENVVSPEKHGYRLWWKSENGAENVIIRFDLETIFHFKYLHLRFKTIRPAEMLVEKSVDHGRTWQIYRYFANDCRKKFPVENRDPLAPDCTEKYSSVYPLQDGDVYFQLEEPFIMEKSNPFERNFNPAKFTNLRINFSKLHTLDEDLFSNQLDIKEKYYYGIQEMVILGTCACNGHSDQCTPLGGISLMDDMVHAKCNCNHHTAGLNCEKCQDLYNDVRWMPAFGKVKNECKKCNCNDHAMSCHFDPTVFDLTGHESGGVCDNCQHNTMGRNCELCNSFFYRDPHRDVTDPNVCLPCDCDPNGSSYQGICDPISGQCQCNPNFGGRRCDTYGNGSWNPTSSNPGTCMSETCDCDLSGSLNQGTCSTCILRQCNCKLNVEGRRCDTCRDGFWNLTESNPDGCIQCSCNTFGTLNSPPSQNCDKETGECICKVNVVGHNCDQCALKYWGLDESPQGCKPCNCDPGGSVNDYCDVITGQCKCRPHLTGPTCNTSEPLYFIKPLNYLFSEAEIDANCAGRCDIDIRAPDSDLWAGIHLWWTGPGYIRVTPSTLLDFPIEQVAQSVEFNAIVRYELQTIDEEESNYELKLILIRSHTANKNKLCAGNGINDVREVVLRTGSTSVVEPSFCLEAHKNHTLRLQLTYRGSRNISTVSILIDSILLTPYFESIPFMEPGTPLGDGRLEEFKDCREAVTSSASIPLSPLCKAYHFSIGAYIHGGGYPCECDPIGSKTTICEPVGGKCYCKSNVDGRKCNRCSLGTYEFGPEGCKACNCNNSGTLDNTLCDEQTGQCRCKPHVYGRSCDRCQPGSWNFPNCQLCTCNGHADTCDQVTGVCINCKNSTEGSHCEKSQISVKDGEYCTLFRYHQQKTCQPCDCDLRGTDPKRVPCDKDTGQCSCLANVTGISCNQCAPNHWNIESGKGCEPCGCDIAGSELGQCDQFSGQCHCKKGFGGRQCDKKKRSVDYIETSSSNIVRQKTRSNQV